MAFPGVRPTGWMRRAPASIACFILGILMFAAGCSSFHANGPSLQGTWLLKSDKTPPSKGVKAILTQQGSSLSGRALNPDGSDYLLLEGNVSQNGVASSSTYWKGVFVPDPGESPCSAAAVARFFGEYGDAAHPGYACGTMALTYDAQTQGLVGSKTYFHVVCQGDSLTKVEQPNEAVTLTRAEAAADQEQSLFFALGICVAFALVVVLLGLGAFILLRSLRRRRVQTSP